MIKHRCLNLSTRPALALNMKVNMRLALVLKRRRSTVAEVRKMPLRRMSKVLQGAYLSYLVQRVHTSWMMMMASRRMTMR